MSIAHDTDELVATTIEEIVDYKGLLFVLNTLAEICDGKADHIQTNWQDKETASAWIKAGTAISVAYVRVKKVMNL